MKKIAIALLLILVTAYPSYARWSVGAAGGAVAAAGGACTPSAAGTVLVGDNTTYSADVQDIQTAYEYYHENVYTASWAGDCETEDVSSIKILTKGSVGGNVKVCITAATGGIISNGCTAAFAEDWEEAATLKTYTFGTKPVLTKSTTYRLFVVTDTDYANQIPHGTGTTGLVRHTGGSATTPQNITPGSDTDLGVGPITIYAVK